ncbi:MAG: SusD/RagB family nutrient-binding outer membrane lipoprotein [Cyclobacteriaceae bacterium]|nr:SusD/RagB family nutrient-binding outer membrane lipoprotein [Cyclobacteriaceae bacterium HetDA_MAG_MS6]
MKKLGILALILSFAVITQRCDSALDINTDPLVATSADPNTVLPAVTVTYEARRTSELGTRIMDVSQHFGACFNSPKTGGGTSQTLTGNTWDVFYTDCLGNLSLLETDSRAAGDVRNNVTAVALIMKSLIFWDLTSIYEFIPYTEALNGQEFPSPAFDDQETVLKGIVDDLDEAIGLIGNIPSSGVFDISQSDVIYQGNMGNWEKFANTLKLRILMMIRNKDAAYADARIPALLNGDDLIETNAEAARFRYFTSPGNQNAFFTIVTAFFGPDNESTQVHGPGPVLTQMLEDSGDPRLGLFFTDLSGTGTYPLPAAGIGGFPSATETVIANSIIRSDYPSIWALPAEVEFYRAEAILKGIAGVNGDAATAYENGVQLALEYWGQDIDGVQRTLTDAQITAYVSSLGAPTLADVYDQQYLESFMRPILSWNTVRRNNAPTLAVVPGSNIAGGIIKRFNYSNDEISANPNTPANPPIDQNMWFEP